MALICKLWPFDRMKYSSSCRGLIDVPVTESKLPAAAICITIHKVNLRKVVSPILSPRHLSGGTLDVVSGAMEARVPLGQLEERRQWREARLSALAVHMKEMEAKEKTRDRD